MKMIWVTIHGLAQKFLGRPKVAATKRNTSDATPNSGVIEFGLLRELHILERIVDLPSFEQHQTTAMST